MFRVSSLPFASPLVPTWPQQRTVIEKFVLDAIVQPTLIIQVLNSMRGSDIIAMFRSVSKLHWVWNLDENDFPS